MRAAQRGGIRYLGKRLEAIDKQPRAHIRSGEELGRQSGEKGMKTTIAGSIALALLIAAGGECHAEQVVKSEPPAGSLAPGATLLVDDGTCGKGKIKRITGGSTGGGGRSSGRQRECIPR
jgi:hypothetical protein